MRRKTAVACRPRSPTEATSVAREVENATARKKTNHWMCLPCGVLLLEAAKVTREVTTAGAKRKIVFGIRRVSSACGCGLEFVLTEEKKEGLPTGKGRGRQCVNDLHTLRLRGGVVGSL